MSRFLYRQRAYLIPFLVLWIAVGYIQLFYSQNYIIIELNRLCSPLGDFFFSAFTNLGSSLFVGLVVFVALYYSYRRAILIFLAYSLSGLFVQLSKRFIFPDSHRPMQVLADVLPWMHTVPGIQSFSNPTFPSGHTAAAFALFTTLAFSSLIKILCLLPPTLVAYSRIYLLQHYLWDVHAGALVGTFSAVITYHYVSLWLKNRSITWANDGLRDRLR